MTQAPKYFTLIIDDYKRIDNFRLSYYPDGYGEMSELAEGARLEIVCAVKSGTEGSNPSLSAIIQY